MRKCHTTPTHSHNVMRRSHRTNGDPAPPSHPVAAPRRGHGPASSYSRTVAARAGVGSWSPANRPPPGNVTPANCRRKSSQPTEVVDGAYAAPIALETGCDGLGRDCVTFGELAGSTYQNANRPTLPVTGWDGYPWTGGQGVVGSNPASPTGGHPFAWGFLNSPLLPARSGPSGVISRLSPGQSSPNTPDTGSHAGCPKTKWLSAFP